MPPDFTFFSLFSTLYPPILSDTTILTLQLTLMNRGSTSPVRGCVRMGSPRIFSMFKLTITG